MILDGPPPVLEVGQLVEITFWGLVRVVAIDGEKVSVETGRSIETVERSECRMSATLGPRWHIDYVNNDGPLDKGGNVRVVMRIGDLDEGSVKLMGTFVCTHAQALAYREAMAGARCTQEWRVT